MEGVHGMTGPAASVLSVHDVSVSRGQRRVLSQVSFAVAPGELVALMGASGSGKTTILRTISGLDPFQAGRICLGDLTLEGGVRDARALLARTSRRVGMVFQFHHLFEHLSALENVCLAPVRVHGVSPSEAERRARELLSTLGVAHRAEALPRELSGGEAQRVAIARSLAVDPPLLLMDEPTASLDAERRADLGALLQRLTSDRRALLVATHDEAFAAQWATRVLRLQDGVTPSVKDDRVERLPPGLALAP
jgi:ABC-type polar amino acid transport system ATPase subunit